MKGKYVLQRQENDLDVMCNMDEYDNMRNNKYNYNHYEDREDGAGHYGDDDDENMNMLKNRNMYSQSLLNHRKLNDKEKDNIYGSVYNKRKGFRAQVSSAGNKKDGNYIY